MEIPPPPPFPSLPPPLLPLSEACLCRREVGAGVKEVRKSWAQLLIGGLGRFHHFSEKPISFSLPFSNSDTSTGEGAESGGRRRKRSFSSLAGKSGESSKDLEAPPPPFSKQPDSSFQPRDLLALEPGRTWEHFAAFLYTQEGCRRGRPNL